MQLDVCVNKMTPFEPVGPFAAVVVLGEMTFDSDVTKRRSVHEARWRTRQARKCSPFRDMDSVGDFVYFRTLFGVQSSPLRFAQNRALPVLYKVVRYRSRHGERPYPSGLS